MKIVFEDGEEQRLKQAYNELESKERALLIPPDADKTGKQFTVTFTVTEPWLADYVMSKFLTSNQLDNALGIHVTEIGFNPNKNDKFKIIDQLQNALEMLKNM